jgi:hypothetical protein
MSSKHPTRRPATNQAVCGYLILFLSHPPPLKKVFCLFYAVKKKRPKPLLMACFFLQRQPETRTHHSLPFAALGND